VIRITVHGGHAPGDAPGGRELAAGDGREALAAVLRRGRRGPPAERHDQVREPVGHGPLSIAALRNSAHWEVVTSMRPMRYSWGTEPRPTASSPRVCGIVPAQGALPAAPMVTSSIPWSEVIRAPAAWAAGERGMLVWAVAAAERAQRPRTAGAERRDMSLSTAWTLPPAPPEHAQSTSWYGWPQEALEVLDQILH